MSREFFPAIIERATDGFGVYFPDLPGCVSAGDTIDQAARAAAEALALHLHGMSEDGDAIPRPSAIDNIERDPEVDEVTRLLVPAELPGRKVRVNVMLDEGLLAAIDAAAANRSQFLADAARSALRGR